MKNLFMWHLTQGNCILSRRTLCTENLEFLSQGHRASDHVNSFAHCKPADILVCEKLWVCSGCKICHNCLTEFSKTPTCLIEIWAMYKEERRAFFSSLVKNTFSSRYIGATIHYSWLTGWFVSKCLWSKQIFWQQKNPLGNRCSRHSYGWVQRLHAVTCTWISLTYKGI